MNTVLVLRIVGVALLAVGVVLLVMGLQSTDTLGEGVRQELTGSYSDRTTGYLIGGIALIVIGAGLGIVSWRIAPNRSASNRTAPTH